MIPRFRPLIFGALSAALLTGGCKRHAVTVYTVPKEAPEATAPAAAEESPATAAAPQEARAERARPQLSWGTLPAGWQEATPGQVSAAQFSIKTDAGEASVNITPLPNLAGKEALVVNMWREQVGQPPLEQEQLAGALSAVDVAGEKGQLFEITGQRDGATTRILTAILHKPDASWFFKLAGSEAGVASQKDAFLGFLKTVRIGAPTAQAAPAPQL